MPDALAEQYGYVEAREASGLLFCSGQIGIDADGQVPADPERQYALAFAAIGAMLQRHGLTADDVVDLLSFHVGYPRHMAEFMRAKAAFMGSSRSCWTAIGVAALGYPQAVVEIKVTARLRAEANASGE